MIIIKRFIEKVSAQESRHGSSVIIPIDEARLLRDAVAKLIADNYELTNNKQKSVDDAVIQVEINGGKW
jgi:metal-dependent hydrolase (beta-lactamase superfamily II)